MIKLIFACSMIAFAISGENTYENSLIQIIQDAGYAVESHKVHTEDQYILSVFRLPSKMPNPKIAFFMHGIESSAADYVIGGGANGVSLPYLLSDNGYDVWMGNARGNIFSQNHQTLEKSSHDFWNFSFHEIGLYDLPAMIDYVLETVNGTSLTYIGHSQGTTVFFVLLSMRPEYSLKISTAHLMAPVAYMRYAAVFPKSLVLVTNKIVDVVRLTHTYEWFNLSVETRRSLAAYCDKHSPSFSICKQNFMTIGGDSPKQYNEDLMPKTFQFTPASSGYKQFLHYGQLIKANGKFLQFDHERSKNLKMYNRPDPPPYNLSNIKSKIHFLYATNDVLTHSKDVLNLMAKLKTSTIGITKLTGWNHLDFLYGKDISHRVNYVIYNKMKSYK